MLVGRVEYYSENGIAGWARNEAQPEQPALVDILLDGSFFARIRADLPRGSGEAAACGFRLVFPPEIRFRQRRALIEVRFAETGDALANSPRAVRFADRGKRVLVMSPAGVRYNHDDVKCRPWPLQQKIETYSNTGDWMVYDSCLKLLDFADVQPFNLMAATDAEIEKCNAEYDYAFLRGSNYIHEYMEWNGAVDVLGKLKIPVVAFSVGAQAPSARKLQLPQKAIDFWKSIADHSASIGVRGTYSAEVLNDIGIRNVEIIGCPSLFRHNDPFLRARIKPLQAVRKIAFNLRREVSGTYTSDAARYLGVQKAAIRSLARQFDITVTTHGEQAEKAFFFQHPELSAKYRSQLIAEGWFDGPDDTLIPIYENQLFYNETVADYDRFIRTQDLAMGFRVHGNLPALANGVPAIVVDYDSRSRELADTFRIPVITLDEMEQQPLSALYRDDLWDAFHDHYPAAYRQMAAFLDRNGLAHNMAPDATALRMAS